VKEGRVPFQNEKKKEVTVKGGEEMCLFSTASGQGGMFREEEKTTRTQALEKKRKVVKVSGTWRERGGLLGRGV